MLASVGRAPAASTPVSGPRLEAVSEAVLTWQTMLRERCPIIGECTRSEDCILVNPKADPPSPHRDEEHARAQFLAYVRLYERKVIDARIGRVDRRNGSGPRSVADGNVAASTQAASGDPDPVFREANDKLYWQSALDALDSFQFGANRWDAVVPTILRPMLQDLAKGDPTPAASMLKTDFLAVPGFTGGAAERQRSRRTQKRAREVLEAICRRLDAESSPAT